MSTRRQLTAPSFVHRGRPDTYTRRALTHTCFVSTLSRCSYYDLCKWNERFERAYLLNAREYAAWERRQKEALDTERKVMASVPGWVVNKPRYYTTYQRTPHFTEVISHDIERSNYL